ncbi:CBS domain-containing protein [Streptomyces sp. NPDC101165]|uniref:CBS domain-containing protein n=1 Tax=Streptomyces sp. NPDC101165 TaxID=3366119 RepID=UPI0038170BA7
MREWRVSALPVLEDVEHVVGVVSLADLLPKEEYSDRDVVRYGQTWDLDEVRKADAVTAGELMNAPPVTVAPDALAHAARIMARNRVKRLPVVGRDGTLKGIVSRSDLLKVFLRDDKDIAEEVRREVVVRLFGTYPRALRGEVHDGVVTLVGRVHSTALIPLAARLARAVAGVADVQCALTAHPATRTSTPTSRTPTRFPRREAEPPTRDRRRRRWHGNRPR